MYFYKAVYLSSDENRFDLYRFSASIDKIKSRKTSDREHQVDWVHFVGCIVIALEVDHGRLVSHFYM